MPGTEPSAAGTATLSDGNDHVAPMIENSPFCLARSRASAVPIRRGCVTCRQAPARPRRAHVGVARKLTRTDQESRSAGRRAAASVTVMDITIHAGFLPHEDPTPAWPSTGTARRWSR